jgi:hypothetical protein
MLRMLRMLHRGGVLLRKLSVNTAMCAAQFECCGLLGTAAGTTGELHCCDER